MPATDGLFQFNADRKKSDTIHSLTQNVHIKLNQTIAKNTDSFTTSIFVLVQCVLHVCRSMGVCESVSWFCGWFHKNEIAEEREEQMRG